MRFVLLTLFCSLFYLPSAFGQSNDNGAISELTSTANGEVVIKLDSDFPKANADGQCAKDSDSAKIQESDKSLVKFALIANAKKSNVVVGTKGCNSDGTLHVTYMYIYN